MARTYTPSRRYYIEDAGERLKWFRELDTTAREMLRPLATTNEPLQESVSISTNEGAEIHEDTLAAAEAEMASDHLTPRMTSVFLRLGSVGSPTVGLYMWKDDPEIHASFSSEDEGLVLSIAARFDRMMPERPPVTVPSIGVPDDIRIVTTGSRVGRKFRPALGWVGGILAAVIAAGIAKALGWV